MTKNNQLPLFNLMTRLNLLPLLNKITKFKLSQRKKHQKLKREVKKVKLNQESLDHQKKSLLTKLKRKLKKKEP